eukprot:jgi/Undpi1/7383/HiC_scaffold_22.g09856.m1
MKPAAGGSLFYDCFHPRGPKPLKTWFGAITRAWGGMFDCCGGGEEGGNRNFVRVGDRMVPRGRPVTASEWEYLEARAVVVVSPRIGISLVKTPSEVYPTEENKSVICFSDAETSAIVRKLSSGNSKRSWLGMLSKIRWGMKNERAGLESSCVTEYWH